MDEPAWVYYHNTSHSLFVSSIWVSGQYKERKTQINRTWWSPRAPVKVATLIKVQSVYQNIYVNHFLCNEEHFWNQMIKLK